MPFRERRQTSPSGELFPAGRDAPSESCVHNSDVPRPRPANLLAC